MSGPKNERITALEEQVVALEQRLAAVEETQATAEPDAPVFVISKDAHVTRWPDPIEPQAMLRTASAEWATYDDSGWNLNGYL